ncbi:MAG: Rab family GTPase [Geminicoccaceae bacterium]
MTSRARKLCLLGDFSVGKTSLIRRYVHDKFSLDYHATVGVQVHQHTDEVETDHGVIPFAQVIWDIEGSRFGEELVTNYVLGSAGALIVGDASRHDAIPSMRSHAQTFLDTLPGRPIVFALNKCDLVSCDKCPEARQLSEIFGCDVVRTSALTGDAVKTLFHALARRILEIGA